MPFSFTTSPLMLTPDSEHCGIFPSSSTESSPDAFIPSDCDIIHQCVKDPSTIFSQTSLLFFPSPWARALDISLPSKGGHRGHGPVFRFGSPNGTTRLPTFLNFPNSSLAILGPDSSLIPSLFSFLRIGPPALFPITILFLFLTPPRSAFSFREALPDPFHFRRSLFNLIRGVYFTFSAS